MTHSSTSPSLDAIDSRQLVRIEATHRGFFYQHLYAAIILLRAQSNGVRSIAIERDEDIEVEIEGGRIYLQLKTRQGVITGSDVAESLARSETLRTLHQEGSRPGTFDYWIVANCEPGPALAEDLKAWPTDMHLITPARASECPPLLPAPCEAISQLMELAAVEGEKVPCGALMGQTLSLKLAACVQAAAAGISPWEDHRFAIDELSELFEQVAQQLQTFPATPVPYLAHDEEPAYESDSKLRMIVGHSGAGKTAWASEASLHSSDESMYFDVSETSNATLPASLARELTAKLFPSGDARRDILRVGNSGLDSLRALNNAVAKDKLAVCLYLDNCQRVEPESIVAVVASMPAVKVIVLAQPSPNEKALAARLGVTPIALSGWSPQVIAKHVASVKCNIDLPLAERVRTLTGGLPLYVLNMTQLAITFNNKDVAQLCSDIEGATHATLTAQEVILTRVFDAIGRDGRRAAAALSLSDVSLLLSEARSIVEIVLGDQPTAAAAIRDATTWNVVNPLRDSSVVIHDAFRVLINDEQRRFDDSMRLDVRMRLKEVLLASIPTALDLSRQRFFMRLLPLIGQADELAELATSASEEFREMGLIQDSYPILLEIARSEQTSVPDRIWAYDTLAMWDGVESDYGKVDAYVDEMERLAGTAEVPERLRAEIESKKMLRAGRAHDMKAVRQHFDDAMRFTSKKGHERLILRYNFASAAFLSGDYGTARDEADQLTTDYYEVLGLRYQDVFAKNPPEIAKAIENIDDADVHSRHLADCLRLHCQSLEKVGQYDPIARLHAHKFYLLSHSYYSAAESGKEVVEDFIDCNQPGEAGRFVENNLLPFVNGAKLLEFIGPVHLLYAVVLAYLGKRNEALAELEGVRAFMSTSNKKELDHQENRIKKILRGEIRLGPPREIWGMTGGAPRTVGRLPAPSSGRARTGRNEPCTCGSGLKFKKCCGKR